MYSSWRPAPEVAGQGVMGTWDVTLGARGS